MDGYWPGNQVDTSPDMGGGVHGAAMEPMGGSVYGQSAELSGSVYGAPQMEAPEQSYEAQLDALASRPQPQMEQELEY
jgi:hypothetical protein